MVTDNSLNRKVLIAARNKRILAAKQKDPSLNNTELGLRFGVSACTIRDVLKLSHLTPKRKVTSPAEPSSPIIT